MAIFRFSSQMACECQMALICKLCNDSAQPRLESFTSSLEVTNQGGKTLTLLKRSIRVFSTQGTYLLSCSLQRRSLVMIMTRLFDIVLPARDDLSWRYLTIDSDYCHCINYHFSCKLPAQPGNASRNSICMDCELPRFPLKSCIIHQRMIHHWTWKADFWICSRVPSKSLFIQSQTPANAGSKSKILDRTDINGSTPTTMFNTP